MKSRPAGTLLALALGALISNTALAQDGAKSSTDRSAPVRFSGAVTGEPEVSERRLIPPLLWERRGDVVTKAVFPFYFERSAPDDKQRFVLPYYWRRGKKMNADVAAGLFWSLRGPNWYTFAIPPFYSHSGPNRFAHGLPPLFAVGRKGDSYHAIFPPLLTWFSGDKDSGNTVIGPYFNISRKQERWWGLAPIIWGKSDGNRSSIVVPPLLFRFADEARERYTTVLPPFYHRRDGERRSHGIVPLWSQAKGPDEFALTVPWLLFHYGRKGSELSVVTPGVAYFLDDENGSTLVTPIFQAKRGPTNMNAVAPLFFHFWDDRDASHGWVVPPFYWNFSDPANNTTVLFPFLLRKHAHGLRTTWVTPLFGHSRSHERHDTNTWIAPTFQYAESDDRWKFNIHPLLYVKRAKDHAHNVLAPIWWDFSSKKDGYRRKIAFPLYWDFEDTKKQSRNLIAFPAFWHFQRGQQTHSVALNTYVGRNKTKGKESWRFDFFPLLSMGGGTDSSWWKLLYGLAGYERRGQYKRIHTLFIPITISGKSD